MAHRLVAPALVSIALGVVVAGVPTASHAGHFGASTFTRASYSIPTTTPTEAQWLSGSPGPPAVIGLTLTVPTSAPGRVPAVVVVHGSTGLGPNIYRWAAEMSDLGVAVATVDSFNGRGIAETTTDPSRLPNAALAIDAYRVLATIATDRRIDPKRIAILGFSDGGYAALYTAVRRFQRLHGPAGREFAAHLAFYPPCGQRYVDDDDVSDRPLRIFHGTADDWASLAPCQEYVARLKQRGRNAELIRYPAAHHAFDVAELPDLLRLPGVRRLGCATEERPLGVMVNRVTGRPISAADGCMRQGATIGHDPRARDDAVKRVKELLISAFGS